MNEIDFPVPTITGSAASLNGTHYEEELAPTRFQLKPPKLYKVTMLNDDYTPMDFVISLLEKFFAMSQQQAVDVMLKIHTKGKAVCGIFSRDVAETKSNQVNEYARQHGHPLLSQIEATEGED